MPDTSPDRYTFDDGRVYVQDDTWMPSVSEVISMRPKPPGLKRWQAKTSQQQQDKKSFYTQNRGTLIHYELLSSLVDEEFWSDDEQHSEDCLRGRREHRGTGLTGGYETWQRFQDDLDWATDAWEMIIDIYGITPDSVLDVELYVTNTDVGYAGQFDLLYVDDGDVVLADLKTSKRVYDKHLIQCVAYRHAVPIAVDRMEVIRINPDGKTWEVSKSDTWPESDSELWNEFTDLRHQMDDSRIESMKERAQQQTPDV